MCVDIGRGADVAVPQPLLDLLHGDAVFEQQGCTAVPQPLFPQQLAETVGNIAGFEDVLFDVSAVGTVGGRGYGTFDDEKPGLHVVGKGHVRGDFPIPRRPRRGYIFPAQLS